MAANKENWGNSFNANYSAKIGDDVNKYIHSTSLFEGKNLDDFQITNILLNELAGIFKFETDNDWLLDNENVFWWNLIFYGRVGILKLKEHFVVVRVSDATYKFGKLISARIIPAKIAFAQNTNSDLTPQDTLLIDGSNIDNLVVVDNDVTNEYFFIKYGWLIQSFKDIWEKYLSSNQMRIKKIAVHSNTVNEKVLKSFENSMNNNDPYLTFNSPQLHGDMMRDAKVALENNFKIDVLPFKTDDFITIADVSKHWKFGKDILGMNENSSDTKERVVSTEIEDSETNTVQIAETKMRNYRKFERHMLSKFGIKVTVKKTVEEELPKVKNSNQAFNQGVNENEV